jgi:hypothetical protein
VGIGKLICETVFPGIIYPADDKGWFYSGYMIYVSMLIIKRKYGIVRIGGWRGKLMPR